MAPRPSQQRRTLGPQSEQFHELGVAGRKTGITLRDTGIRDEHGMEPIDALYSSPNKEGSEQDEGEDDSGDDGSGEDMDITTTSGITPAALLNGHTTRLQMPLPQSRSPVKTSLGSPAQRNRSLGSRSSPLYAASVRRPMHSSSQPLRDQSTSTAQINFNRLQAGAKALSRRYDDEEEDEQSSENAVDEVDAFLEESLEILGGGGDDDEMVDLPAENYDSPAEEEEQPDQATAAAKRKPGRKPKPKDSPPQPAKHGRKPVRRAEPEPEAEEEEEQAEEDEASEPEEPPVKPQQRGRPAKNTTAPSVQITGGVLSSAAEARSKKRRTPDDAAETDEASERGSKKPRSASPAAAPRGRGRPKANTAPAEAAPPAASKKSAPAAGAAPSKLKRGRKRKSSIDPNQVKIPRGPPLPRSRGLMINRERNEDPDNMHRTRSGRTSYKPLAFWRNEHVEFEMEEAVDDFAAPGAKAKKFLLPSIKEVVRVDEPEVEFPSARKKKGRKGAGRAGYRNSDDVIAEAWEKNPGSIEGEVQLWDPEHERNPPGPEDEVEIIDRQLAVSGRSIKTTNVKNATFKFAKTVSEGFFGAGVVDMPPGSTKTQKNSRKMFMTFFVFSGRVLVTVGENEFRISKGGMWFVPRGNYYSIENDYDQPARIFFAQGCEVQANSGEGMGDQSAMMSVEADQSQAE